MFVRYTVNVVLWDAMKRKPEPQLPANYLATTARQALITECAYHLELGGKICGVDVKKTPRAKR